MNDVKSPEIDALIRAEVDRAVAPYVGVAPPFMLAKLRELSERYWREHPQASRALELMLHKQRILSGTEVLYENGVAPAKAAGGKGKGKGKV